MTASRILTRLKKVEDRLPEPNPALRNIDVLYGWELDRLIELLHKSSEFEGNNLPIEEEEELLALFAKCPILEPGEDFKLRPDHCRELLNQWRWRLCRDPKLPKIRNYTFKMGYYFKDILMDLSIAYGWDPVTKSSEMLPFEEWREEDRQVIYDLFIEAVEHCQFS